MNQQLMCTWQLRRRRAAGVIAVEMAVILSAIAALMIAIAILGQVMWKYTILQNVANSGARWIAQSTTAEMRAEARIDPAKSMMRQAMLEAGVAESAAITVACEPLLFCDPSANTVKVAIKIVDMEPNFLFSGGVTYKVTGTASYGN